VLDYEKPVFDELERGDEQAADGAVQKDGLLHPSNIERMTSAVSG
jgi:hypothetical protein